jgi:hypothetical protein
MLGIRSRLPQDCDFPWKPFPLDRLALVILPPSAAEHAIMSDQVAPTGSSPALEEGAKTECDQNSAK